MLFPLARSWAVGQHCYHSCRRQYCSPVAKKNIRSQRLRRRFVATNRGGAATEARAYTGVVRARYEGVG